MLHLGIDQHAKQLTVSLRNEAGDVVLNRQVSTEPRRFKDFFKKLQKQSRPGGFLAVVEVSGFNAWLLKTLPSYGAVDVVLI